MTTVDALGWTETDASLAVVVAFREFSSITDETIANERKRFRGEVVVSIENFAKRSTIRNLKNTGGLSKDDIGLIYDHFQLATLRSRSDARRASISAPRTTATAPTPLKDSAKPVIQLERATFGSFLGQIATWARDETKVRNGFHEHVERSSVDHELIDRIFVAWDQTNAGALSFQDVVNGLDSVLRGDLMSNISWLFDIHDNNHDGMLTKDEVLQLSESLLVSLASRSITVALALTSRSSSSSATSLEIDISAASAV